jgi:prepilin-type N-terminal cleavage/methylation domain-containing protein
MILVIYKYKLSVRLSSFFLTEETRFDHMDAFNVKKNHGFTVFELILVILIIGIISVTAIPNWTGSSLGLEFEARRVLNDIRYTQALSMASGMRYRWVRTSSSSYQILNQSGAAMILPSGGTTVTMTNSVSFGSLGNLPSGLVAFDSQGIPYTTSSIPGTALASAATIPLTANGVTRTVRISQSTGYGVLQ